MAQSTKWGAPAWVIATVLAAPAYAITPEEVWQNWQDMGTAMGQAVVAGAASRAGDTLTITDATFASASGGVTAEGSIAQILMQDQGDGTVLVTMSPEYPIKLRLPNNEAGKPDVEMNITILSEDLEMLASGAADAIRYDVTAPEMKLNLQRLEGAAGQPQDLTLDATLTGLAGVYNTAKASDGGLSVDSDFAVAGMAIAAIGSNAADQSELRLTAAVSALALQSKGALLGALAGTGVTPELLAGMDSLSKVTAQSSEFDAEIVDASGTTAIKGTAGAMLVDSSIAGGVMRYETSQDSLAMTITAPSVPVPDMAVTLDKLAFGITTPLVPTETAQPFSFATRLTNLGLSDQLWAMFDPSGQLPRDPINLVIDSEGMATVAAPEAAAMPNALPANLESLNLKELRLGVAGAELTGSGTSTFAPVESGLPDPNAKLDFTLTGANALMDKLVAAGLIPPEALTMPRMMLAMVASPAADGSDSYSSTIEIKDKSIFANGQMLHQME